jgi:hypothetical protein
MDRPNISWAYNFVQCSLAQIVRRVGMPGYSLRVTSFVDVPTAV